MQDGSDADLLHFYPVSAAVKVPLWSHCPPLMDLTNADNPYNVRIYGREVDDGKQLSTIHLLWSAVSPPKTLITWPPTHIILLQNRQINPDSVIKTTDCATATYHQLGIGVFLTLFTFGI